MSLIWLWRVQDGESLDADNVGTVRKIPYCLLSFNTTRRDPWLVVTQMVNIVA